MAISDSITKLHAICSDCSDTANYSYRKSIHQDRIVISEKDEYKALCRVCFYNKKTVNNIHETILTVDLEKLAKNFLFKNLLGQTKIIGVVKAFGYGHGDLGNKKIEELGVYALWVTDFEEAINLRKGGVKTKIIVANPGSKSYEEIIKYNIDVIIYSYKCYNFIF